MKKYGIIAILLLVLTAGGIGAAHFVINGQQHDVTITETTLSGDRSQADGLLVKTKYEDAWNTVNWWTTYDMTANEVISCEMDMENEEPNMFHENMIMETDFPYCSGTSPNDIEEELSDVEKGFGIPKDQLLQVISTAENGKATKAEYKLKDYLEYLPVTFYQTQEIDSWYDADGNKMSYNDYFRFPVPEGATAELSICKRSDGTITTWAMNWNDENYELEAIGEYDQKNLYFATSGISLAGDEGGKHIVDMPEDSHGIHVIPLAGSKNAYFAKMDEARCSYPFEKNEKVLLLKDDADGNTLLLCTKVDQEIYLSIIDKETMSCRQKLPIMKKIKNALGLIRGENFIMVIGNNNDFVLLEKSKSTYEIAFRGNVGSIPADIKSYAADFDGERLAFASFLPQEEERDVAPQYQLQVFDQSGQLYRGEFESSLTDTDKHQGIHVNTFWQRPIDFSFDGFDN